jgi:hypothetical protein
MTAKLEAAIAAIVELSSTERQQLLQILIQDDFAENSPTELELLNVQFWQGISLGQLRTTQTPSTVDNLKDLAADFWPEEDSIEEFLNFLQQQRQDIIPFFEILARHTHRRGRATCGSPLQTSMAHFLKNGIT